MIGERQRYELKFNGAWIMKPFSILLALLLLGVGFPLLAQEHGGPEGAPPPSGPPPMRLGAPPGGPPMGPVKWKRAGIPEEQQEKLQQIHKGTMELMKAKAAEMRRASESLRTAMGAYPIGQERAMKLWETISRLQKEMFQARLAMVAQMQQIVGEDAWGRMRNMGRGPGARRPPGAGPPRRRNRN